MLRYSEYSYFKTIHDKYIKQNLIYLITCSIRMLHYSI